MCDQYLWNEIMKELDLSLEHLEKRGNAYYKICDGTILEIVNLIFSFPSENSGVDII